MKIKLIALVTVIVPLTYAIQYPDDEFLELLNEVRNDKTEQGKAKKDALDKKNATPPLQERKQEPVKKTIAVAPKPKKQVTYKELIENFDSYKTKQDLNEFSMDKEQLLEEVNTEIQAFEEVAAQEYAVIKRLGAVVAGCAVVVCAPWIPNKHISDSLHTYIKCGISSVGALGMFLFSGLTGKKYAEYKNFEDKQKALKARHEEVREWLLNLK